jgi:DNA-binding MarR family transcriptional regulator
LLYVLTIAFVPTQAEVSMPPGADSMPKDEMAPPGAAFDVANRLFFRLYQASNLMHKNGTRYVADFGATTQQWAVLGALARPSVRAKGMSVKDLIEFLLLSRQNLTVLFERLEARGWIDRDKDPEDARSRLIRLSAEGERIWTEMLGSIETFYARSLAGLTDEEQVQLYHLLDRLKVGLNNV